MLLLRFISLSTNFLTIPNLIGFIYIYVQVKLKCYYLAIQKVTQLLYMLFFSGFFSIKIISYLQFSIIWPATLSFYHLVHPKTNCFTLEVILLKGISCYSYHYRFSHTLAKCCNMFNQ